MHFPEQGKQPPAVILDTGLARIDDVLALALLFGFAGRKEVREGSISVSRFDLQAAQFCDAMRRFYAGNTGGGTLPVGISSGTKAETPMVVQALARSATSAAARFMRLPPGRGGFAGAAP